MVVDGGTATYDSQQLISGQRFELGRTASIADVNAASNTAAAYASDRSLCVLGGRFKPRRGTDAISRRHTPTPHAPRSSANHDTLPHGHDVVGRRLPSPAIVSSQPGQFAQQEGSLRPQERPQSQLAARNDTHAPITATLIVRVRRVRVLSARNTS